MRISLAKREFEKYLAIALISLVLITLGTVAWIAALASASIPLFVITTTAIVIFFIPYSWAITKITR